MYVYTHVYIHVYTHTCAYTCVYTYMCIHVYMHVYTHTCVYTHIHPNKEKALKYADIQIKQNLSSVYIHECTYMFTRVYKDIHTYM